MNMVRIFLSVNDFIRFTTGSLIDFLLSVQTKNRITQKKIEISRLLRICPILVIVSKSGRVCVSLSAALNLVYNVGSYTQGRIAGDFLSGRKTARAERCPPKTTATALAG